MNASVIATALASRAEDVCRHYLPGGRRQGRYWIAGNIDGTPGRSLYVRLAPPGTPGKWNDTATSDHGDLLDIVRHRSGATTLHDALKEARRFLALAPDRASTQPPRDYDAVAAARRIWDQCIPLAGTHGEAYLAARAIPPLPLRALRYHSRLRYREGSTFTPLPAIVAAATDHDGTVFGIHRTWLDRQRPDKASVPSPRKALGNIHGLAVRLVPHSPHAPLVVGEGIETVLSFVTAFPHIPAAAALSACHLAAFTPPPATSHLVIAADNDPEGEDAANRLNQRIRALHIPCTVILPNLNDFNDDLRDIGRTALASRTIQQLTSLTADLSPFAPIPGHAAPKAGPEPALARAGPDSREIPPLQTLHRKPG